MLRPYIDAPFLSFSRRRELLERIFHLQENQTTVRRELFAGLTTFMAMAYVVVVNPQILSAVQDHTKRSVR
jgi:AGZA family xanthine/uracil permease-like MFS transporter